MSSASSPKLINKYILYFLYVIQLLMVFVHLDSWEAGLHPTVVNSALHFLVAALVILAWGAETLDWLIARLALPFVIFAVMAMVGITNYGLLLIADVAFILWIRHELRRHITSPPVTPA